MQSARSGCHVVDDQGEELFPVEKDALKGSDAMYYFKSNDKPGLHGTLYHAWGSVC